MAKVIKKRIRWNASTAGDVSGYKVYWAKEVDGNPDYDSENVEVADTDVVIPDETPSFPVAEEGNYIFGISAVDDVGNESDLALTPAVPLDFDAPTAPSGVIVENV